MKYKISFYCHLFGDLIHIKKIILQILKCGYPVKGIVTQNPKLIQWANEQDLQTVSSIDQLNATEHVFCMLAHQDVENIKISNNRLLLVSDYRKLVNHWNDTQRSEFLNKTFIELIELQTQKAPDNIAVIAAHESLSYETLTYRALQRRVNQLAHYLEKYVIAPNQTIALCTDRGVNMISGILGIMKAGAAYIPLSPDYPKERLIFILNDAKPTHLLIDDKHVDLFSECTVNKITFSELDKIFLAEKEPSLANKVTPSSLAYMIYTSGSTGTPKGVMIQQQALANHMLWMRECFYFDETDVFLQKTPFSFDASIWELLMPLVVGAKLVFASQHAHQDPYEMIQEIQSHQVTVLQLVPSMLRELLWYEEAKQCHSLKHIFVGGESLTPHSKERFSQFLPDKQLHNLYGPTEATIDATWFTYDNTEYSRDNDIIGKPICNMIVYIFDAESTLCPIGKPGELYIGGVGLAVGYHDKPELTKQSFLDNPFSEIYPKLYRTGDLVQWLPDGKLKYISRIDEQIKIHGCRVEIGEIEVSIKEFDSIKDVVVLAQTIHETAHLIAYLVIKPSENFVEASLRESLTKKLPHFMLPSHYVCVEQFPKLPNGKINRRILLQNQQANVLDESKSKNIQTPRDHDERLLATLWENALGSGKIDIHDNFFDMGGNSLSALKILTKIRTYYDIHIGIRDFLENPTIADLATFIRQAGHQPETHACIQYHQHTFSLPLINLRKAEKSSQTPLFLIHPVGGTVFWLASLAKYLSLDIPIYAIQTPELELGTQIFPNLEETAKCYIQCIQKIQPVGPYRLGGGSFGANVSIEMAKQLHQMSQEVEFLLLFDGWARYPSALYDLDYFKKTMQRQYDVFTQEFKMQTVYDPDNLFALQYKRLHLLDHYHHTMIKPPLFLFKSQELLPEYEKAGDDACNYWQPYAEQPVSTIVVPGNHETMFYKPNVQVLAAALTQVLQAYGLESEK